MPSSLDIETRDAATNLALEEWFFRRQTSRPISLIYQNEPAVLCGRNQNLAAECDVDFCQKNRIPCLRRISGGGTVFHDLGNLNVCLIVPRRDYAPEKQLLFLLTVLKKFTDTEFVFDDRHSLLTTDGRKLAGSAFALAGGNAMLHFCLLVNSDLTLLSQALKVSPTAVEHSPIASVRKPVANLTEFCREVTIKQVKSVLQEELANTADALPQLAAIAEFREKYLTDKWNFRL